MSIYRSTSKEFFLEEVTNFIATFKNNFKCLSIIVPNEHFCDYLQKYIISKLTPVILPEIKDIGFLLANKKPISLKGVKKITTLEERIILTKIIKSYKRLYYSIDKTINLASSLIKLFFDFEANNVDFDKLKTIPTLDQAEHWNSIYDFLEFTYKHWQKEISAQNKITSAQYQKLLLNSEIQRVKESGGYLIIVGLLGENKITREFFSEISKIKNTHIILPPFFIHDKFGLSKLTPEDPLYNIGKLLSQLTVDLKDIPYLGKKNKASILDNLLTKTTAKNISKRIIRYIEFDNISLEAEYVAQKCHKMLTANHNIKIAVLLSDKNLKNYFITKFYKYEIKFLDLIGENILNLSLVSFILEIAKNRCKKFFLQDFISLISHPFIISNETRQLKQLTIKKNRFCSNINTILEIISDNFTDKTELTKLDNICRIYTTRIEKCTFSELLNDVLEISKELYPNLSEGLYNKKVVNVFIEIIELTKDIDFFNVASFTDILKELISDIRIYNNHSDLSLVESFFYQRTYLYKKDIQYTKKLDDKKKRHLITLCSDDQVTFLNYDLIVYANFISNLYPLSQFSNPWLNKQIIEQIGLDPWMTKFGSSMYNFYLNLHNTNILITRSVKIGTSYRTSVSPFLLKLKHILKGKLIQSFFSKETKTPKRKKQNLGVAFAEEFPKKISATDIELLIRNPYNFYVKKILTLKLQQEIEEAPKLSDFGKFFHKVVGMYTKNYTSDEVTALERFNDYARELLSISIYPEQIKTLWGLKIKAIAKDFILFEKKRRYDIKEVITEIQGKTVLNIADKEITISAIADRIEINKNNRAVIIDYKTGMLPTKKDIISGLSPQLIIESFILLSGGFPGIGNLEIESLVYIKINGKTPYISSLEIPIKKIDIQKHEQGLKNLLKHYITTGKYPLEPNLMKHDYYWYLARRGKS